MLIYFVLQQKGSREKVAVGIRAPYLRAVGIQADQEGRGHTTGITISAAEEKEFKELAQSKDVYERIARSIAPSIFGFDDIKKSVACLLFGGSRKLLPDGLARRGDINLLLLGDPGTAKSQLLKFVEKVAPIAVYTSGKGSSAAGLTASVIRDPVSVSWLLGYFVAWQTFYRKWSQEKPAFLFKLYFLHLVTFFLRGDDLLLISLKIKANDWNEYMILIFVSCEDLVALQ